MNSKLHIEALVTDQATGAEKYWEGHRWTGIDAESCQKLTDMVNAFAEECRKERDADPREDDDQLTAVFSSKTDDIPNPDIVIAGFSYATLVKMEHKWHKLGEQVLKWGEHKAKEKKEKKAKKK